MKRIWKVWNSSGHKIKSTEMQQRCSADRFGYRVVKSFTHQQAVETSAKGAQLERMMSERDLTDNQI